MNRFSWFILVLIFVSFPIFFLISPLTGINDSNISLSKETHYFSKEIGPRPAGSENESLTAQYLLSEFSKYGANTEIQEFKYYSLNSPDIKKSQNVVATIKGVSDKQIIICADLDTAIDSSYGNYTEGANDDSASLALLLGLAKKYSREKPFFTIKLIAFGASEDSFTFPLITPPRTDLKSDSYYKIVYTPYLVGARYYVLKNQEELKKTVTVISLEAIGVGDPCFVNKDAFSENNNLLVNFLVNNARINGINANKIDFSAFNKSSGEGAISHIYLPFAYAGVPSTFLTCMKEPVLDSQVHNQSEIPDYLTVNDTYENLIKNNVDESGLENHLQMVLFVVKNSIDKLSSIYVMGNFDI